MSWEKIASDMREGMALQFPINDLGVWGSKVFLWLPRCVNSSLRLVYSLSLGRQQQYFAGIWAGSFIFNLCRVTLTCSFHHGPGPGLADTVSSKYD